jgi:hypothetical protein
MTILGSNVASPMRANVPFKEICPGSCGSLHNGGLRRSAQQNESARSQIGKQGRFE